MAPRRGGGGGGGSGNDFSGTSSSGCGNYYTYECATQLHYVYGDRVSSQFTRSEVYGQLVLYAIWTLALIGLFTQTLKSKARWLQAAVLLYAFSFIFLCVRFGLILSESDVRIGYRYESSVVVLLQRGGIVFLVLALLPSPDARAITKMIFYPAVAILAILNVAYIILDFLVTSKALAAFKAEKQWRLTDRDFGLTLTSHGVKELTESWDSLVSPFYVERKLYDIGSEDGWQKHRSAQINVGLASDCLALVLTLLIAVVAAVPKLLRRKRVENASRTTLFLILAAFGLLLATLFRLIISAHYIFHNWKVVADPREWLQWYDAFTFDNNGLLALRTTQKFLRGYRTTVQGYPVVQSTLEPLGVILAILGTVLWSRSWMNGSGL